MQTNSVRRIGLQVVLASSVCGATFQLTGCLSSAAQNFNPCGTVLNCDPAEWDLMLMDPLEPNYDYNPTCPIPGLFNCEDPISGLAGAATTTTGTTGNTNTNSTRGSTNNSNRTGNTGGFGT
jgi:hypothetical protein